jgi:putative PIN family toxin of toxin-antitoxin system
VTRVILDTNVLLSGLTTNDPRSAPGQIIDAWHSGHITLLISTATLAEVAKTLTGPFFAEAMEADVRRETLQLLATEASWVVELSCFVEGIATLPEDDLMLSAALSGNADYVVTGDVQLQRIRQVDTCHLCSPAEFLAILANERAD